MSYRSVGGKSILFKLLCIYLVQYISSTRHFFRSRRSSFMPCPCNLWTNLCRWHRWEERDITNDWSRLYVTRKRGTCDRNLNISKLSNQCKWAKYPVWHNGWTETQVFHSGRIVARYFFRSTHWRWPWNLVDSKDGGENVSEFRELEAN